MPKNFPMRLRSTQCASYRHAAAVRMSLVALALVLVAATPPATPPALIGEPPTLLCDEGAGAILLKLEIDPQGRVTDAQLVEGATPELNAQALELVRGLTFTPAQLDGAPVTVRILYRLSYAPRPPPEEPAPPPKEPSPKPSQPEPPTLDVKVLGTATVRERRSSPEAITVLELVRAKREVSDLGDVMARAPGISIQRTGGLGSVSRFSLNGLTDDQVRFFLDGVPLEQAGYAMGFASIPVPMIDRIEVYRGVVPVRLGADTLGGAVNFLTNIERQPHFAASYTLGSFGTHRVSVAGHVGYEPWNLVVRGSGFFDYAKNDYLNDVEVADDRGRLSPARLPRFHDSYRSYGGNIEALVRDLRWARSLSLKVFASTYGKELQSNLIMSVPYGEVTFGETTFGATLAYEQPLHQKVDLKLVANYARRIINFTDKSKSIYDWTGKVVGQRANGGEVQGSPNDQTIWQDSAFARVDLAYRPHRQHTLNLSLTTNFTGRNGKEHLFSGGSGSIDPLTLRREFVTFVAGLEHQANFLRMPNADESNRPSNYRLQNSLFVKAFLTSLGAQRILLGNATPTFDTTLSHSFGVGDGLRVYITPWLLAKVSYEYATRLPRPDELFGNGALIAENLALAPEVSHNGNAALMLLLNTTRAGAFTAEVNGFLRASERLIVLLGSDRFLTYQNILNARSAGVEGSMEWISPSRWFTLEGALTYQDIRNTSVDGPFGYFAGNRIPNRPWLFGSIGARVRIPNLPGKDDTLEPFYTGRFVQSFYRSWESIGDPATKETIPTQMNHSLGITYSLKVKLARITATFEVHNIADAALYDVFGSQRPGRGFYFKLGGEL